jgi:hypothetical protein
LVNSFKEVVFPAKHQIAKADEEITAAIYIIQSGQVYAANEKANTVYTLVKGCHFGGETLMMGGDKIISEDTIIAENETKCWMLTRGAIEEAVGDISRLGKPKPPVSARLDFTIQLDQLDRQKILGIGGFGKVWLVKYEKKQAPYALKVISKKKMVETGACDFVKREKNLMASVDHPLIVDLVATMQDRSNLYMLLNFIQGGELYTFIHRKNEDGVPNKTAQFYAACIVEALNHLHARMICYRDLKPENVLIDKVRERG